MFSLSVKYLSTDWLKLSDAYIGVLSLIGIKDKPILHMYITGVKLVLPNPNKVPPPPPNHC